MPINNTNSGFIALISVIIVGSVLLIASVTLALNGFYGRFNVLNTEFKEISNKLVDACLERARLSMGLGDYTLDETITVLIENYNCEYIITDDGAMVKVHARVQDTCTDYEARLDPQNLSVPILSIREREEDGDLSTCD